MRKLPSRRYQASYIGPDLARHSAPFTFDAKLDAEAWLAAESRLATSPEWTSPKVRTESEAARRTQAENERVTLARYAEVWLAHRDLKPRTRSLYRDLLDRQITPALGDVPIQSLTPARVREWHAGLDASKPRLRAHAYALLRTVCSTAVHDDLLAANPCRIRGAGQAPRKRTETEPATPAELDAIVEAMPTRLAPMVLLGAWCALRYGEMAELRRKDIDLRRQIVRVDRAVVWVDGKAIVGTPKSDAGVRMVSIPPHMMPALRAHLATIDATPDSLLFPSATDSARHLQAARFYAPFNRARIAAGRPDLRVHDLRHTGATFAAMAGATLAETMHRLGHSTPAAAMRYQHAARGRDAEIASALSSLVSAAR